MNWLSRLFGGKDDTSQPVTAVVQPQQPEPPQHDERPDEQFCISVPVRGGQYNNRQAAIKRCVRGEQVQLVREPNNPHSQTGTSILICSLDGQELGYVPHEVSVSLAPIMDAGQGLRAEVDWTVRLDKEPRGKIHDLFKASYGFGVAIRIGVLK